MHDRGRIVSTMSDQNNMKVTASRWNPMGRYIFTSAEITLHGIHTSVMHIHTSVMHIHTSVMRQKYAVQHSNVSVGFETTAFMSPSHPSACTSSTLATSTTELKEVLNE